MIKNLTNGFHYGYNDVSMRHLSMSKTIVASLMLSFLLMMVSVVGAADDPGTGGSSGGQAAEDEFGTIGKPPEVVPPISAGNLISGFIGTIIVIAFIAAFFYLLWGGFQWVTSGGDEAAVGAARQRITQALVGLVIVVAAWAIFQLVETILGVDILGENLDELFKKIFRRE